MSFSRLILQILREQNINLTKLYKDLNNLGLNITYPSLYSYFTGVVVPPFSTAKKILKIEKIEIDDEELENVLSYSKKVYKSEKDDANKILNLNLKIKPESVDEDFKQNSKYLKSVIEMRADEVFTDENLVTQFSASGKRKMSAYVAYLIKTDLEKNGLIAKEARKKNEK